MHAPEGTRTARRTLARALLALVAAVSTLVVVGGSPAQAYPSSDEQNFFDQTNAARQQNGLAPLEWDEALANVARGWTAVMSSSGTLSHNPNLAAQVSSTVTDQWTRLGENVGYGGTVDSLQQAFMNSPGHRANILGDYNRVGIGTTRDGNGTLWVTVDFLKGPDLAPPPPPAPTTPVWYLRNSLTTGVADSQFMFGDPGDKVITCDWNGDGVDTAGVFRDGWWYITNSNPAGAVAAFAFGAPGDVPVCGDWNGDGVDTVGVYRNGIFFLRDANNSGPANLVFMYGNPGDYPVVGDWNGDRKATVGVMRDGRFFLRNSNTGGFSDLSFVYGNFGDIPVAGDWNGDGTDSVGIWRDGKLYLTNTNQSGYADYVFGYGDPGDVPVIGDWNGTGTSKLGVVRGGS